jgi:hypothetical protein
VGYILFAIKDSVLLYLVALQIQLSLFLQEDSMVKIKKKIIEVYDGPSIMLVHHIYLELKIKRTNHYD